MSLDDIFNSSEKRILRKHKNRLISCLLPLAIDIQGLSEVSKNKKKEYFTEIQDCYSEKTKKNFSSKINEIFNDLKEKKIKINDKNELFELFENLKMMQYDEFVKKYCNKDKGFFLPSWLQTLVSRLDEIKDQS